MNMKYNLTFHFYALEIKKLMVAYNLRDKTEFKQNLLSFVIGFDT